MEEKIAKFHKKNLLIWGSICAAVLILTAVAYYLDENQKFEPLPQAYQINQVMFILAILLAGSILVFKRSQFVAGKVADRYLHSHKNEDTLDYLFKKISRNYLIVWVLGESIALIGFANYIISADFSSFLIFAVVSAYSLLINSPSEGFIYKCLNLIEE